MERTREVMRGSLLAVRLPFAPIIHSMESRHGSIAIEMFFYTSKESLQPCFQARIIVPPLTARSYSIIHTFQCMQEYTSKTYM